MLADVGISVTANRDVTTRFSHAHLLAGGTYQIGMYLPSDMTGTVTFVAEVDNGECVFATGMATATGVQSGETTKADRSRRHADGAVRRRFTTAARARAARRA